MIPLSSCPHISCLNGWQLSDKSLDRLDVKTGSKLTSRSGTKKDSQIDMGRDFLLLFIALLADIAIMEWNKKQKNC